MNKYIKTKLLLLLTCISFSCGEYLDVVPDNVATIDNAFTLRAQAEKFLFTCYSYLPREADVNANPAFTAGDEFWFYYPLEYINPRGFNIARGNQNIVSPYMNYWDGSEGGQALFRALRDCNIFLENVDKVIDLEPFMRDRWVAEVKFLKAYYHFWLLRMYGPIPIIKENLPVSSSVDEVKVERVPVDEVFEYIFTLINEAIPDLPLKIQDRAAEMGRLTQPAAMSMKAKIAVTAASPLFNGNEAYRNFTTADGTPFFNPVFEQAKWDSAMVISRKAIEVSEDAGHQLFYFSNFLLDLSDSTVTKMNIRNSVAERWNVETLWGSSNSRSRELQRHAMLRIDPLRTVNQQVRAHLAPTMRMAELFYTENGVPLAEDKNWHYADRYEIWEGDEAHRYYLKEGYSTSALHFNREPRFYASLGFDGAIWYGQGKTDDEDPWHIEAKHGQTSSTYGTSGYSVTGYFTKKLVNWNFVIQDGQNYVVEDYPWPIMRLADLYLLYAEAKNEVEGPSAEVYHYMNLIRERAGLKPLEESWDNHAINNNKYKTKEGLREIIHQERGIELAFEGQRFWDMRRWKKAEIVMNQTIKGWDVFQEEAVGYYRPKTLYNPTFSLRDYFWPISENSIIINRKLIQNPGW